MPKMKSKGAVKKRFRLTKNGKASVQPPRARPRPRSRSTGRPGRRLRKRAHASTGTWAKLVRKMMGEL